MFHLDMFGQAGSKFERQAANVTGDAEIFMRHFYVSPQMLFSRVGGETNVTLVSWLALFSHFQPLPLNTPLASIFHVFVLGHHTLLFK